MRSFFKVMQEPQQITKASQGGGAIVYNVDAAVRRHEAAFGADSVSPAWKSGANKPSIAGRLPTER